MEVGWLGGFILLVILLILFMSTVSTLRDQSKDVDDGVVEPSSMSCGAYWFHVHVMDPLVVLLGLANFVVFAANTELLYDDEAVTGFGFRRKLKTWVPRAGAIFQKNWCCSAVVEFDAPRHLGSSSSMVEKLSILGAFGGCLAESLCLDRCGGCGA